MRIFKNKKAEHNYFLTQKFEAGIVLKGSEVKSIRAGKINFKDSYARAENGEIWLFNLHISAYDTASYNNHDPERPRKLLFNRKEIRKLITKMEERGFTLIPEDLYINEKGIVKLTIALAKGKRKYDKRTDLQKKTELRDSEIAIKYQDS
ncbi:MAG: SsrA-binding protein [Candidatus Cloacimonas sp. SDB]|nr:MAG: SsrA-binding protein [Candidatus Cloacimonas sp. SDB]